RIALAAQLNTLEIPGEKTVAPITRLKGLSASATEQHNKGGKIIVLAAQAVAQPCAHGGPPRLLVAGAEERDRWIVVDWFREHRTDNRDFIHDAAHVRDHFTELDSVPAIAFERIRRAH